MGVAGEGAGSELAEPSKRFLLPAAEPGAGERVPWHSLPTTTRVLRHFSRRDQRLILADVSDKSLLLRIGYQPVARSPELFPAQIQVSVERNFGMLGERSEAVGARVTRRDRLPFQREVLEIPPAPGYQGRQGGRPAWATQPTSGPVTKSTFPVDGRST